MAPRLVFVSPTDLVKHPKHDYYHTPFLDDEAKYEFVKTDIAVNGIRTPIYVQKGTNFIVDGTMRTHISLELSLEQIPVEYFDVDDNEVELMLISENNKRQGDEKSPLKIARQLAFTKEAKGLPVGKKRFEFADSDERYTEEQLSKLSGLGIRQYQMYLKLMNLIEPLQSMVDKGVLGVRAGSIVATLTEERQQKFYNGHKNSKRVSEEMARAFKSQCDREDRQREDAEYMSRHLSPEEEAKISRAHTYLESLGSSGEAPEGFLLIEGSTQGSETSDDSDKTAPVSRTSLTRSGNDAKTEQLQQMLNTIDSEFSQGTTLERLENSEVDSSKRLVIENVVQTFDDPMAAESYQTELFSLAVDKGIRSIERVEQDILAVVPSSLHVGKRRDRLTTLRRQLERLLKKVQALEEATE